MPRTQIPSEQIDDQGVTRVDLNTDTAGSAVITKIVAGTNITITETGVDTGTGDVTVNASGGGGTPKVKLQYYSNQRVPDNSVRFLRHGANTNIGHDVVPIVLEAAHTLVGIAMATNKDDGNTDYEVALYRNMRNTPIWVADLLTYPEGSEYSTWDGLSIAMTNTIEYGIGIRKTACGNNDSAFNKIIVILSLETS